MLRVHILWSVERNKMPRMMHTNGITVEKPIIPIFLLDMLILPVEKIKEYFNIPSCKVYQYLP